MLLRLVANAVRGVIDDHGVPPQVQRQVVPSGLQKEKQKQTPSHDLLAEQHSAVMSQAAAGPVVTAATIAKVRITDRTTLMAATIVSRSSEMHDDARTVERHRRVVC